MKTSLFIPFTLWMALALLMGCSKDENEQLGKGRFGEQFGGTPYRGDATGELFVDDELIYVWEGSATVSAIEQTADSVSLVFLANFGDEGEVNLKMRGRDHNGDFLLESPDGVLHVVDSKISGRIENTAQTIALSGDVHERYVSADIEVLFNQGTDVFPAGSMLKLAFRTSRETEDTGDGDGCTMRLVPIWSPNGMTMGMVPDCD
ncbi:hypothetical protein GCM10011386_02660 [Parapedobacter defluvii]|uniref:Uncharacterized protein n=1 Tax=Parapedobacter defluvii TaxID=2045106 RepID=A0ABQ1L1A3_9SPHI|nr:hypothetical protein [Parapedobacter defluvii]GGC14397.1 hypothetical protein GCM10011386_02660 [Parapedobacter defluvii]